METFLPFNFMGIPPEQSDYAKSKVVILPVMYDGTTSYKSGTREGPQAIITASRFVEFYDAEIDRDASDVGIHTMAPVAPESSSPKNMVAKVRKIAERLVKDNKFVIMLGGEHSLTVGMVEAYHKQHPDMAVLQIDAHLDLRDRYDGTPYNHACAMRRVVDLCPVTAVGIRSVSPEENEYVKTQKLKPFYGWTLRQNPKWIQQVVAQLPKEVYITIDLDGLDPSIMPAVGTPEPGGLLWHDLIELLTEVGKKCRVIGCDVVELCPIPGMIAPDFLASKLVYRLIGLYC